VRAHDLPLGPVERVLLAEDRVREPDPAEVVQQRHLLGLVHEATQRMGERSDIAAQRSARLIEPLGFAPMPPTYRERLRIEGSVLAAAGVLASGVLMIGVSRATDRAPSTIGQLVFVTVLLVALSPRSARRSIATARPLAPGEQSTGEPTALWKPPLVLLALTAVFVVPGELGVGAAGWDAGLRITGGCLLVGLAQALLLERVVAADEARTGRSYVRLPGWSPIRGTKLGFFGGKQA